MEYHISNIGLINSIDKQIEELQRKKEALQMGYCYVRIIDNDDYNVYTIDKEEK